MTNSEAIDILKANYPDPCFGLLREAVDTAIYALSAPPAEPETKQQTLNIEDVAVEVSCGSFYPAYNWLKVLQDLNRMGFAIIRRED